jgi:hypothetical protein
MIYFEISLNLLNLKTKLANEKKIFVSADLMYLYVLVEMMHRAGSPNSMIIKLWLLMACPCRMKIVGKVGATSSNQNVLLFIIRLRVKFQYV